MATPIGVFSQVLEILVPRAAFDQMAKRDLRLRIAQLNGVSLGSYGLEAYWLHESCTDVCKGVIQEVSILRSPPAETQTLSFRGIRCGALPAKPYIYMIDGQFADGQGKSQPHNWLAISNQEMPEVSNTSSVTLQEEQQLQKWHSIAVLVDPTMYQFYQDANEPIHWKYCWCMVNSTLRQNLQPAWTKTVYGVHNIPSSYKA